MKTVHLHHDGRLGLASGQNGMIPAGWVPPVADTTVLSFRLVAGKPPGHFLAGLNATSRLIEHFGTDLCTYALQNDSPLAPLFFWDLAHCLPVGGTITVAAESQPPYLGRDYYKGSLEVQARTADSTTFRKARPLPADLDRGLDNWSFGIPTGPGDATGLNAVVKRVLELDVPKLEVILCGRPGANFRYFDKVTVVGEDLVGTPIPIAAKKNRLAEAARYENLCLLHDRVFLPKDFGAAARAFGDLYPVVCFQSLWFDDPYNLVGKRYSDYARLVNPMPILGGGGPGRAFTGRAFTPPLLPEAERGGFLAANPLRYNQGNYCTGSLYIAKRRVWLACPQDARLGWQEMEDTEHGLRCNASGIPHRVNPNAFTQSLFTRPQMLSRDLVYETPDGGLTRSVNSMEAVHFRRKPMAKVSVIDAQAKLQAFASKWVPQHFRDVNAAELSRPAGDAGTWGRQVAAAVYGSTVGFGEENVRAFLKDFESHLVFDTFSPWTRRYLVEHFGCFGSFAKDALVEHNHVLRNMIVYRGGGNLFYESLAEYFPEPSRNLTLGTWFSARRMARHNGLVLHHPDGRDGFRRAILNSTPFREYYEGPS